MSKHYRIADTQAYDKYAELMSLREQVASLQRPRTAAQMLFDGLIEELPRAKAEGRLVQWQTCAENIVALLVSASERPVAEPLGDEPEQPNPIPL